MAKTNRINIFKLRSEFDLEKLPAIAEYKEAFSNEKSRLLIQQNKKSIPEWSSFISSLSPGLSFENYSNSFIYLIAHKKSLYALTGGYGFKAIQNYIEDEFGLNVALRLIDNLSISSIHQFSIQSQTRQIQRSVSNYNPSFDNENYNKILKSISGKGFFSGKNFLIHGKSSVVLRTEKNIKNIDAVLDEIEDILGKEEKIEFYRAYKEVKEKQLIRRLNLNLYRKLFKIYKNKSTSISHLYLDLPDPFKRFDYSTYNLLVNNQSFEINELDIDEIKSSLQDNFHNSLSIRQLINIRITGISIDGNLDEYYHKSLDKLIVCESTLDNKHYIKLDGKWLQILDNIISFIDEKISGITIEKDYLPHWEQKDIKEKILTLKKSGEKNVYEELIYNTETSKKHNFVLLDRKLIQLKGQSKIEIADLYDPSQDRFIHVKNVWGSKSSYLFSQASISSILYANSAEIRDKCLQTFQIPTSKRKTIVIAMAIESKNIANFPFNISYFAKLSLYSAINNIRNNGYDIVLAPISII